MSENEIFELVRTNYNGANQEYVKEQVRDALSIPTMSKEEVLDGLLDLIVVGGCCGMNEHYRKYLLSAISYLI